VAAAHLDHPRLRATGSTRPGPRRLFGHKRLRGEWTAYPVRGARIQGACRSRRVWRRVCGVCDIRAVSGVHARRARGATAMRAVSRVG
jgi:hypothetical protein